MIIGRHISRASSLDATVIRRGGLLEGQFVMPAPKVWTKAHVAMIISALRFCLIPCIGRARASYAATSSRLTDQIGTQHEDDRTSRAPSTDLEEPESDRLGQALEAIVDLHRTRPTWRHARPG
jgi:hypothetical protein